MKVLDDYDNPGSGVTVYGTFTDDFSESINSQTEGMVMYG